MSKEFTTTATFTKRDTDSITRILSLVGRTFQTISANTLNTIAEQSDINLIIKTFNNSSSIVYSVSLLLIFIKIISSQTLDLISFRLLLDLSNFTELCLFMPPR